MPGQQRYATTCPLFASRGSRVRVSLAPLLLPISRSETTSTVSPLIFPRRLPGPCPLRGRSIPCPARPAVLPLLLGGVAVIGYANKPGKAEALAHAGARAVVTNLAEITTAPRTVPSPALPN